MSFFSKELAIYEKAKSLIFPNKILTKTIVKMIIESQISVSIEDEPSTRSNTCIE
jgi:hypothetical protein